MGCIENRREELWRRRWGELALLLRMFFLWSFFFRLHRFPFKLFELFERWFLFWPFDFAQGRL